MPSSICVWHFQLDSQRNWTSGRLQLMSWQQILQQQHQHSPLSDKCHTNMSMLTIPTHPLPLLQSPKRFRIRLVSSTHSIDEFEMYNFMRQFNCISLSIPSHCVSFAIALSPRHPPHNSPLMCNRACSWCTQTWAFIRNRSDFMNLLLSETAQWINGSMDHRFDECMIGWCN